MKKDIMGAHLCEGAVESHEPLLVHVSDTGLQSHSHAWPLLKVVIIRAFIILFMIFAAFLAFGGLIRGQNGDQSLQNREHVSNRYLDVGIRFLPGYGSEINTPNWVCLCEVVHSHLTSFKINELALMHANAHLMHANAHRLANYLAELVNFYSPTTSSFKQHQIVDGSVAPKNVEMPSSGTPISILDSAVSNKLSTGAKRRSRTLLRAKMVSFIKVVHDLSGEGLLQFHHRILCLDTSAGQKMQALKKRGFNNVERIDVSPVLMVSNQEVENTLVETLADQSFDFTFTTFFDHVSEPARFVAEIERILKVGGLAAMHVSLNAWRNKYIRSKPGESVKPVTLLFKTSKIVYVSTAYAPGLDTIIVFKKVSHIEKMRHTEKTKGANQAEIEEKQVSGRTFLSQPGVDSTGSLIKYGCRKCMKEQDAVFTPITMQ